MAPTRIQNRVCAKGHCGGLVASVAMMIGAGGCAAPPTAAHVIFLDGAGHLGAGATVREGLRKSGYKGGFEEFAWSSFLLWGTDHLIAVRSGLHADRLADRITEFRRAEPNGYLALMSLSAGANIALSALERLPDDVQVDYVVLFQPSVSSKRNLGPALRHVRKRLYATASRRDAILATLLVTADGKAETAAGRDGFQCPREIPSADRAQYTKVENLRWRSKYERLGWDGGHTSSTGSRFVKYVIAPRMRGRAVYRSNRPPPRARAGPRAAVRNVEGLPIRPRRVGPERFVVAAGRRSRAGPPALVQNVENRACPGLAGAPRFSAFCRDLPRWRNALSS